MRTHLVSRLFPSLKPTTRSAAMAFLISMMVLIAACAKKPAGPVEPEEPPVIVDNNRVAWLQANCLTFETSKAESGFQDLSYLKNIVGSARIVALGEATHGTKEFFEMKHRILEYLVKEMGFSLFAIEATWPESNLVNDYVQMGQGDPAKLLAGLYFWTWNTQEVLNMILWMRRHNIVPGNAPAVSFYGFDMQYPRMAMDTAAAYLRRVDTTGARLADSLYALFRPYQTSQSSYVSATADLKENCRRNVAALYDYIAGHRNEYLTRSTIAEYERALQSARVVIQGEEVYSQRGLGTRDQFMAENVQWLLKQAGPNSKIVLWAHNGHVSTASTYASMGMHLRSVYGQQMIVFGFDFYRGDFNAVTWNLTTGRGSSLGAQHADVPSWDTYEYNFRGANIPRFFLDLRHIPQQDQSASWLNGPLKHRSIGAVFDPNQPEAFYYTAQLPSEFDVVIYFQTTTSSALLPFYYSKVMPVDEVRLLRGVRF